MKPMCRTCGRLSGHHPKCKWHRNNRPKPKSPTPEKCIKCQRKQHARGLCTVHYGYVCKIMRILKISDEEAIAKGLVQPRKKRGRHAQPTTCGEAGTAI